MLAVLVAVAVAQSDSPWYARPWDTATNVADTLGDFASPVAQRSWNLVGRPVVSAAQPAWSAVGRPAVSYADRAWDAAPRVARRAEFEATRWHFEDRLARNDNANMPSREQMLRPGAYA